jgi:hypothetical protein
MRNTGLAGEIERDLLRGKVPPRHNIVACFMCGYTFVYRGSCFCSDRCREVYDAEEPGHEQDWLRRPKAEDAPPTNLEVVAGPAGNRPATPVKRTTAGYNIHCLGCGKEFESKGLRCCSTECERRYKERQENLALMATVGIEPAAKKKLCASCGAKIPTWRNGRRVSKATQFCGPKCAQRARRAFWEPKPGFDAGNVKKVPISCGFFERLK